MISDTLEVIVAAGNVILNLFSFLVMLSTDSSLFLNLLMLLMLLMMLIYLHDHRTAWYPKAAITNSTYYT